MSEKPLHKPAGIVNKLIELAPDKLIELALSICSPPHCLGVAITFSFSFRLSTLRLSGKY
jgi:hypothetical protein